MRIMCRWKRSMNEMAEAKGLFLYDVPPQELPINYSDYGDAVAVLGKHQQLLSRWMLDTWSLGSQMKITHVVTHDTRYYINTFVRFFFSWGPSIE